MSDIIQLLPDAVANQIAAGEVVQRPASVVKELLENSIDAGSSSIHLIIKDAGKTLIQTIDNGCGMSETDARMCFERHATSKIRKAEDIFNIRTKGFRGEAMASIAAVAHVELKTKLHDEEVGSKIEIEGSKITSQEPIPFNSGTSIAVKNLFFNIPARRNFLKSAQVEMRHIIDEFHRVVLTHPDIEFKLTHNDVEMYHLISGTIRQRIVGVFGDKINQKLVPIEEKTTIVNISGFIGKAEFAKKTKGDQYFFVNNRFIKSAYLHHAVSSAYDELIHEKSFPSYFLYLEVDPSFIDINIHPTKTEIKFEDERSMYAILNSSVKQSLGKYQVTPTLDFNQETSFNVAPLKKGEEIMPPQIKVNPDYNPFKIEEQSSSKKTGGNSYQNSRIKPLKNESFEFEREALTNFYEETSKSVEKELFDKEEESTSHSTHREVENIEANFDNIIEKEVKKPIQIHQKYILSQIKSGFILIDQQRAHERILYEKFIRSLATNNHISQQELFPQTISFSSSDYEIIKEIWEDINLLGYDIEEFGNNTISINGVPSDCKELNPEQVFETFLEQFKNNASLKLNKRDQLARSIAYSSRMHSGKKLSGDEMLALINDLFACETPNFSPNGKSIILTIDFNELNKRFG